MIIVDAASWKRIILLGWIPLRVGGRRTIVFRCPNQLCSHAQTDLFTGLMGVASDVTILARKLSITFHPQNEPNQFILEFIQ